MGTGRQSSGVAQAGHWPLATGNCSSKGCRKHLATGWLSTRYMWPWLYTCGHGGCRTPDATGCTDLQSGCGGGCSGGRRHAWWQEAPWRRAIPCTCARLQVGAVPGDVCGARGATVHGLPHALLASPAPWHRCRRVLSWLLAPSRGRGRALRSQSTFEAAIRATQATRHRRWAQSCPNSTPQP